MAKPPEPLSILTLSLEGDQQRQFVFHSATQDGGIWFLVEKDTYGGMLQDAFVDDDIFWESVIPYDSETGELFGQQDRAAAVASHRASLVGARRRG
jgi:hypothetical protein